MGIVQQRVKADLVDFCYAANITGHAPFDFLVLLALQFQQVPDLERFAPVTDIQLAVPGHRPLVYPEYPQLADKRVDIDFEHVGYHVPAGVRADFDLFSRVPFAAEDGRRIALAGIRHQPGQNFQ